jgi:hypothetical protein
MGPVSKDGVFLNYPNDNHLFIIPHIEDILVAEQDIVSRIM